MLEECHLNQQQQKIVWFFNASIVLWCQLEPMEVLISKPNELKKLFKYVIKSRDHNENLMKPKLLNIYSAPDWNSYA